MSRQSTIRIGKLTVDQSRVSQIHSTVGGHERKSDEYRRRDTNTHPRVNIARIRRVALPRVSVEAEFLYDAYSRPNERRRKLPSEPR